jgi:methylated-DNA-[protein]-cysteine S-methyltransferase
MINTNFPPRTVKMHFTSAMGPMVAAASDKGLAGLWFDDQRHLPDFSAWPQAEPRHPVLRAAIAQLQSYLAGERKTFDLTALPLDLSGGTAFQQSVWQGLLKIPPGTSTSYGQLSADVGNPKAVRAVGAAVGRNPIGIIVPCHRVLGADGSLTGYAGGLHRKIALLALEGVPYKAPLTTGRSPVARDNTGTLSSLQRTGNLF